MSAPSASSGSMLLRIDDTSTRIQYEGQWSETGNLQDNDETSHVSSSAGASAKFVFNGTFITVYGSVFQNGSSSSYKLDDAPPVTTIVQQVPSTQNNWPFYYPTAPLEPGLHELIITVLGGTYSLDYIDFTSGSGEENNNSGSDAAVLPTSATSPSSAMPSKTASPDSGSQTTTSSKGLPTAAIAGIAVAAALVVLAVALALFYIRRRSARRVRHQSRLPEKGIDILVDGTSLLSIFGAFPIYEAEHFPEAEQDTPTRAPEVCAELEDGHIFSTNVHHPIFRYVYFRYHALACALDGI
ncbi:hypothetical protein ONZ51_g3195 [Trametes cubensis]|uniref:Uncharacterized protein n=1 Tax=Trametes cubensis TaxID=1111947 RepID=A0AAD7XD82_9APHY|nr:hypothetical protein ONZ51_g3195 [Trametes cubensis]